MKMKQRTSKEFNIMVIINMLIIIGIMIYGINNIEQTHIENYAETNTYVQYIERSDNEKYLPIAGITEEMYSIMSDQSLLGDTSLIDVTVTDSQQENPVYEYYRDIIENMTEQEYYQLAKINECEAGNQTIETRMLIVLVVFNRVKSDSFPGTIEGVITENHNGVYQFSPLCKGGSWYDTEPSEEAYKAVDLVIEELFNGTDTSDGALYFESCEDEDNWHSRNLEYLYQSDDIRFYK